MFSVVSHSLATRPAPPGRFLLLVDDHEPSLQNLETLLETVGYTCVSTVSPADALAFCGNRRPSLVVTDLMMPRLDGHGLARGLKARFPGLPIVLLTGEVIDASKQASFGRTFTGVFSKPLEVEPFLALVERLMPPNRPEHRP